ncbi:MAG: hypothetical protein AAFR52_20355 [Pseudomonadota bacterium]
MTKRSTTATTTIPAPGAQGCDEAGARWRGAPAVHVGAEKSRPKGSAPRPAPDPEGQVLGELAGRKPRPRRAAMLLCDPRDAAERSFDPRHMVSGGGQARACEGFDIVH